MYKLNYECLKFLFQFYRFFFKLSHFVFLKDLCLDESLTIKETFEYYGTLYNMKKKHIKSRIDELNRYLQLPDLDRYIKDIR